MNKREKSIGRRAETEGKRNRIVCLIRLLALGMVLVSLLVSISIPVLASVKEETEEASKIVRVGWFEGTYNTTGANGERSGYSYEYQQEVAANTGWTYEYVTGDWLDLMKMLENGELDLLSCVSYSEDRAKNMLFSDLPMGEERYYLYVDLSCTDISAEDLTSLNGKCKGCT